MKKIVTAMVVVGLAVITAGCSSEKKEVVEIGTAQKIERPTTTTTAPVVNNNDAGIASLCVDSAGEIVTGLDAIVEGIELLPYVSDAEVREFLATADEFVQTSIETLELCAHLSPAEFAEALDALETLADVIDEAETLY